MTPITKVIKDMESVFEEKYNGIWCLMHCTTEDNKPCEQEIKSHINETIVKVLERMREECEGRKKDNEIKPNNGDFYGQFARNANIDGYNASLQSQIDLITKVIKEIQS